MCLVAIIRRGPSPDGVEGPIHRDYESQNTKSSGCASGPCSARAIEAPSNSTGSNVVQIERRVLWYREANSGIECPDKLDVCLAPGTVRKMHGILHKALEQAVKWGIVPRNICKATTPPKPSPEEIRPLDAEQAKQLLEAARWRPPSPKKALP